MPEERKVTVPVRVDGPGGVAGAMAAVRVMGEPADPVFGLTERVAVEGRPLTVSAQVAELVAKAPVGTKVAVRVWVPAERPVYVVDAAPLARVTWERVAPLSAKVMAPVGVPLVEVRFAERRAVARRLIWLGVQVRVVAVV